MSRLRRSRTHKAQRDVHRASRTRVNLPGISVQISVLIKTFFLQARTRDIDQIQLVDLDPKNRAKLEAQELDYERPGLAQHYCVECAKYYETDSALRSHWKSKVHKRRCKALKEPAYTIEESERAAGLGRDDRRAIVAVTDSDVAMSQS
ncbi:hypothetical protein BJV78DRAFT_1172514 [Lactifluus subvellereus]|nr:hypothetical protein BJV78DRAFT_1172514 [Lactifluus subvellereus]